MKINKLINEKTLLVMGILNYTPDSFSDGGDFNNPESALSHAKNMIKCGADIIDLGCESTRPNADIVSLDDEIKRISEILPKLRANLPHTLISIDTYKPEVARYALENGADIINDVSGLSNFDMIKLVSEYDATLIVMHNGDAKNCFEVFEALFEYTNKCNDYGLKRANIIVDPGIGFGKDAKLNIEITKYLNYLTKYNYPVLYGCSRKRTVDYLMGGNTSPKDRDLTTTLLNYEAIKNGANIIRVHNVRYAEELVNFYQSFNN